MIISIAAAGCMPTLLEADNFHDFRIVLGDGADIARSALRPVDADHAFVPQSFVISLYCGADRDSWHKKFKAMVAKATSYGWIDAGTGDVRAHITRHDPVQDKIQHKE